MHVLLGVVGVVVVLAALGALMSWMEAATRRSEARLRVLVRGALENLNQIQAGRRYVGRGTDVVEILLRPSHVTGHTTFRSAEVFCRTAAGSWFWAEFDLVCPFGRWQVAAARVRPASENEARRRLEPDAEAYVRFFGEPEVA